ncbi:MAG: response regulator [Limnospira sp. PMC 1291.21]|uniref:Probable transcriptional regulator ycf27 n=3 Tax=Limnospira TaxID=2596745 RepID=B5W5Q5_LIMMA|nr:MULTISPECIES: response regulator [Limnospira]EKD10692.1 two component transcriptional regulator winged helix family protein [Arthrospira platensis C1]MDC0838493.1 response regulator [Limnoraphis robusta]MDY7053617.1 response regulator [Limnospira fusiformis LS22]QJB28074.1 response regulator [Limnospira fusiformis SAG 85.79]EDZ93134.1 two component transcriptional regulator, winged helix family [Limnospira maxima CS-328]
MTIKARVDERRNPEKILIADDESAIRRILTTRLSMVGYSVVAAADGLQAIEMFDRESPDLVVLDVMMPRLNGYGVCQKIRAISDIPIIMLTALGDVADRITGLELGADDYLTKPFSPKELEARIHAILRRFKDNASSHDLSPEVIQVDTLRIDTIKRRVYKGDKLLPLTYIEFNLLELLFKRSGEAVSRSEILQQLWGYTPRRIADMRVVDVHVARLRAKIETDQRNPEYILTVRGIGYSSQRLAAVEEAIGA